MSALPQDSDLLGVVGPAKEFGKLGGSLGFQEGQGALVYTAAGAVHGYDVTFAHYHGSRP